jgi:electron transfer flavoprotein beta subunit
MNIIVCVKQVIDPEAPPSSFKIDGATNKAEMKGAPPVIDPYGEYAVEAALKLKDASGAKITVVSLGNNLLREVVKKPLAMGADELVLLEDEVFTPGDSRSTAFYLAAAIKKIGEYDLVLCGRESSDNNAGQTGIGIAAALDIPCITLVRKLEAVNGNLRLERVTSTGYEIIEVSCPAVATISNEVGEARYPTIKGIMAAKKKEPLVWKQADIDGVGDERRVKLQKLFQPVHEGRCEFAAGETPEEAGTNLAQKLREAKIL